MRDTIDDFFSEETKPQDTLLLYYSGHGISAVDGDVYLARPGFSKICAKNCVPAIRDLSVYDI